MNEALYYELLRLLAPEVVLVLTVVLVLAVDLVVLKQAKLPTRWLAGAGIASAGCAIAAGWLVMLPAQAYVLEGMLVLDGAARLTKLALLVLAVATFLISAESNFTEHVGEFLALLLLGLLGMLLLVSSEDILMVFLSLELTSLCLYVLTGFAKADPRSAEASLKYFLFGGVAAACTLYGFSLLYGIAGSTNLSQIARAARDCLSAGGREPLMVAAMVLVLAGFAFKVAVAPFHLWAPDTYQGAPTPAAAFIASGSKVAGIFVLAKVVLTGFAGLEWSEQVTGWVPLLAVMSAASMLVGNLAALVQGSVRRLLAYSAVAHSGYMLLGVMAQGREGWASLLYYAFTYALTALGAFAVVSIVEQRTGGDRLADFAGFSRKEPLLAGCMAVFVLSLAGIPPLAGFFGKFYLFARALTGGGGDLALLWLVTLALLLSAVSLYYYLGILKQMYIVPSAAAKQQIEATPGSFTRAVVVAAAGAVILLGCAPELLLKPLLQGVGLGNG